LNVLLRVSVNVLLCVCLLVSPVGLLNGSMSSTSLLADKSLGSSPYHFTLGMILLTLIITVVTSLLADKSLGSSPYHFTLGMILLSLIISVDCGSTFF